MKAAPFPMILPMGKSYFPHSFYSCFRGFVQANYPALPQRVLTLGLFCALQRRIIRYSLSEISDKAHLLTTRCAGGGMACGHRALSEGDAAPAGSCRE